MTNNPQDKISLPISSGPNLLAIFAAVLLVFGASMLVFCCSTIYQIFTAPHDVALMKAILDHAKDGSAVVSGNLDGKAFRIEFSDGFGWMAFLVFMLLGIGAVIGALSAIITAGVMVMKLAYGQPLYAYRSDRK
jgi:hypothetical protein